MNLVIIGRLFFSLGIIAYGVQQIIIKDFRPQIVAGFPAWAHEYGVFAILTGIIMIVAGLIISGLFRTSDATKRKICLYIAFYFLALIVVSHIPYLLFVYPHKLSHLGSWGDALKELAFSGAAFVMADSLLTGSPASSNKIISKDPPAGKFISVGRIFFCTTIILFGCNHFAYDLSKMVPGWFGMPVFWSYFGGAALIASGTAILLKILLQPVSLLLAVMLFLWFLFLHIPGAIADPYTGRGNRVVSAFDALLFCGTALVLSRVKTKPGNRV